MTSIPQSMRAVIARSPGGPETLVIIERPVPSPAPSEILVAVRAAGLNRADILQRIGKYPPPAGASDVLGMELSGIVAAVGADVTQFEVGDRVMALVAAGGYAAYAVVPASIALPIPPVLSFAQAAAVPEAAFTVWHNVFERGALKPGETLLVHGGTSGVGTFAIQVAKAKGARVIATAGSQDKCAACRSLGAEVAINYRTEDFVAAVLATTANRGANVILDIVGGDYVGRNYAAAAEDGRIVQIATQAGVRAGVDLRLLMGKRLTHTGSTLRGRDVAFKAQLAAAVATNVLPLVASGAVKPVIDATFPFEAVADAHRRLELPAHIGKIVLTIE